MTPEMSVADDKLGRVAVKQWELFRRVKEGTLEPEWVASEIQHILEGRVGPVKEVSVLLVDWQRFYRDLFGLEVGFTNLPVPANKGFDRLIAVVRGMVPQRLYDKCKALFPCWKWADESLDNVVQSERTAQTGDYAVWFRDTVEADEDLKNLSADDLKKRSIPGITLEERLLYELKYFKETGGHMDRRNITLCTGSRCSDGGVPNVNWDGDGLSVGWCLPGHVVGSLRSRRAVL